MWESELIISSVIKLSVHSIIFFTYNALSDIDPNNNKEK